MIFNQNIYHFKVTCLNEGNGKPYRVIAIENHKNLTQLAEAILGSFKFNCDHCFGFYENIRNWTNSKLNYERFVDVDVYTVADNPKSPDKTKIKKLFSSDVPMLFLFDYGHEWRFTVKLVGQSEPVQGKKYPLTLEKFGNAPKQYGKSKIK